MISRILIAVLAFAFGAAMPLSALGGEREEAVVREEDLWEETAYSLDDDDDTDDSASSFTSGINSNDKTNSRHTPVTRDRDRSRGDLTRDRTKDGPGKSKRDWTKNKTNDRSRNDTR
ncbi:MAG TPA: hypothetical protein VF097_00395 [Actinomycetota bacterium]